MRVLFDTDLFIYQICMTLTYNKEVADYPPIEHFYYLLKKKRDHWLKTLTEFGFQITEQVHFLTAKDRSNFRYDVPIEPEYKHNRQGTPLPFGFQDCVKYCIDNWGAQLITGMEADDAIGIEASANPQGTIRISEKDLRMIPGWHFDISASFPSPLYVTDPGHLIWCRRNTIAQTGYVIGWGIKWFWFQMLVGDKADGVVGIPGMGDSKAFKLLSDAHTLEAFEDLVYHEYERCALEDKYDQTKKLLWICRTQKDIPGAV